MPNLEEIFQEETSQHRQEIMSSILVPKTLKTSNEGWEREREKGIYLIYTGHLQNRLLHVN